MRFALPALRAASVAAARPLPVRPAAATASFLPARPLLAAAAQRAYAARPPTRTHSPAEAEIREKLVDRLEAEECDVEDTSGGCGTFYQIRVSSPAFVGLPTVKQHRLVNDVLKEEIKGIHGLQLKTSPTSK